VDIILTKKHNIINKIQGILWENNRIVLQVFMNEVRYIKYVT